MILPWCGQYALTHTQGGTGRYPAAGEESPGPGIGGFQEVAAQYAVAEPVCAPNDAGIVVVKPVSAVQ